MKYFTKSLLYYQQGSKSLSITWDFLQKKNCYGSNLVPLKQSTRNALIRRRQDFPINIRPTDSIVLEF